MSIKFNVYYATSANGPWHLANPEPLDRVPEGNEYTVSGLQRGSVYHVAVVGGRVEDDEFIPLMDQEIGPESRGAGDLNIVDSYPRYKVKTFTPEREDEDELDHTFNAVF